MRGLVRVLVAGASGFLGIATVRALAAAGYEVIGIVRSKEKGATVEAAGCTPAVGDLLDLPSLLEAARGCEALLHLAATVDSTAHALGQSMAAKVRVDGTYNLIAAARAVKARRLIVGSGTWLYGDRKETITENSLVDPYGTSMFNWQAERAAFGAQKAGELDVVVLRPGMVYGNGGWFREMVEEIRGGCYNVPGDGTNHWSPLHIDDCGEAFRVVLEKGKGGDVYVVADDEPVTLRAFVDFIADTLRVARPPSIPLEEAAKKLGGPTARHLAANQVLSNAKIQSLGWRPLFPNYRLGVPSVARAIVTRAP
jgi:nucleoside-diphosphate-sugar epimerase